MASRTEGNSLTLARHPLQERGTEEGSDLSNWQNAAVPRASFEQEEQSAQADEAELRTLDFVLIVLSVWAPNMLVLVFFSEVFDDSVFKVIHAMSDPKMSAVGDALVLTCGFSAVLLYIFNWPSWPRHFKVLSALLAWFVLVCPAAVLKCVRYPWAPCLLGVAHVGLFVGLVRCSKSKAVAFSEFYGRVTFVVFAGAVLLSFAAVHTMWFAGPESAAHKAQVDKFFENLNVTQDICRGDKLKNKADPDRNRLKAACLRASSVKIMVGACPLVMCVLNLIIAMFTALSWVFGIRMGRPQYFRIAKLFILALVVLLMAMYTALELIDLAFPSAALAMSVVAVASVAIMGWLCLEHGEGFTDSFLDSALLRLMENDWTRAFALGALAPLSPGFFLIEMARECFNRSSGKGNPRGGSLSCRAELVVDQLRKWHWASVLSKFCILGELYFLFQVGVSKLTVIFLSFLTGQLWRFTFKQVVCTIFAIGFVMFMLPPVPGIPVYMFVGIVVAKRAEEIGFWTGCAIAVGVSFALKLLASAGQYAIGWCLGKSVKVQQMIGVDKVLTRAIEDILKVPELTFGKVAVLVGGPDWPTSVTCGILRMNLCQMVLGTCPVVVTMAPTVLAGAFMGKVNALEETQWDVLSSSLMGVAVMMQMLSMLGAMLRITDVVETKGEELRKPRPEHQAVEELTKSELGYDLAYREVTDFKILPWDEKVPIGLAATLMMASGCCFALLGPACFRPFVITSDISDSFKLGGLDGNPLNVILWPIGWGALGVFFVAACLHRRWTKAMAKHAARRVKLNTDGEHGEVCTDDFGANAPDRF